MDVLMLWCLVWYTHTSEHLPKCSNPAATPSQLITQLEFLDAAHMLTAFGIMQFNEPLVRWIVTMYSGRM
jgi:hypothetical protein